MKAEKHIWATADRSRVVEEGDPEAGVLLYAAGDDIPDAEAQRLGIGQTGKRAKAQPEVVHSTAAGVIRSEDTEAATAEAQPPAEAKAVDKGDEGVEDKATEGPRRSRG